MFDVMSLFISKAMADDTVAAVAAPALGAIEADTSSTLMRFMPLFLIFGVFYFLLIRPQQKQMAKQADMLKELKKGDKVITGGGFVGTIAKVDGDDYLMIDLAKDVRVKAVRSTVQGLVDLKFDNDNKTKKAS